ncbi:MAG: helicase-associated domain-containing protein, partial [Treponema sp.]|nr:helicase-associated domain-containing protein [Treponema sp.]
MSLFRSVSFWQSALMILPDDAFFVLLQSILGTVKTPYNKQTLVEELSRFIARPEINETIAAYIDGNDRRIIAAIALLDEPVHGELESFFTGEYSYAELQGMLLNLEERLIIYRFRDNGILRIALNPRLENILAPYTVNTGILFPTVEFSSIAGKEIENGSAVGALSGRTLAALFAFLLGNDVQVKDDGEEKNAAIVFRKKTAEQGKELFPGLDINSVAGGLFGLGLLVHKREGPLSASIVPDEKRIKAFKKLSDRDRFEYLAGSIALFLHVHAASSGERKIPSFQSRGLLKNIVRLIHSLCNAANDGRLLPEATIIKLAELFRRQEEAGWGFMGELPSAPILLRSLVISGLFTVTAINGTNCYCLNNTNESREKPNHPLIAMDSGFSCILYPGTSFADAMDLAVFSALEETGTTIRFNLSRDSVIRGFDRGYGAEFICQLLERLSGTGIPDTLKWNLSDWEKRWQEISLNHGVVLTLGEDRKYLAQTEPLASMICRSPAPGVYLLSANLEEAAAALHDAGVDIIARPNQPEKNDSPSLFFIPLEELPQEKFPPQEETLGKTFINDSEKTMEEAWAGEKTEQIKQRFRQALNNMNLSKQEKEELESRIERRMIVSETQLKDSSLRYEKLEARSLDYAGKTSIVRQAILSASLLELSCLNGEKILGVPESLDKKGNETIIVINPKEGGEPVKLTLGKISL